MIQFMKDAGLDTNKLVGKGFDGAANMSGHISGVSTRLQQAFLNAKYLTHCRNHALNLAIVASCTAVPDICNFMNTLKEVTLFFKHSAKRMHILREKLRNDKDQEDLLADLEECYEGDLLAKKHHHGFPVLSDTWWLSRVDSIHCLLKHYWAICEVLEAIEAQSVGSSANDANAFLRSMMSFEFITSAVISQHILAYSRPLTIALQGKDCDLLKANKMAQRLKTVLKAERSDTDRFESLWKAINNIAQSLDITPTKKRTVGRQQNQSNPNVLTLEQYYRVSYFNEFWIT